MFITNLSIGFSPPKEINGISTFQDPGPLENNPLIIALSEVVAMFPLVKELDFIVSLGIGAPRIKDKKLLMSMSSPLTL